jgi:hypothetical protein
MVKALKARPDLAPREDSDSPEEDLLEDGQGKAWARASRESGDGGMPAWARTSAVAKGGGATAQLACLPCRRSGYVKSLGAGRSVGRGPLLRAPRSLRQGTMPQCRSSLPVTHQHSGHLSCYFV